MLHIFFTKTIITEIWFALGRVGAYFCLFDQASPKRMEKITYTSEKKKDQDKYAHFFM